VALPIAIDLPIRAQIYMPIHFIIEAAICPVAKNPSVSSVYA